MDEAKNHFLKLIQNNPLNPNLGNFKIHDCETDDFLGLAKLEIKEKEDDEAEGIRSFAFMQIGNMR